MLVLKNVLRVCLFGSYVKNTNGIPSGNGGILIKKLLEIQDISVVECHKEIKSILSFFSAYVVLAIKHSKIEYDIMVIPWRGILTLPLAKVICRKPIVYFPAFSIYDTLVNDRKKIKKKSFLAKILHSIDKIACKWSDLVILESTEEINYFVKEFNLPREKFRQLFLSSDESLFFPKPKVESSKEFTVLYFGEFIPLHGLETVIEAAKILSEKTEIVFVLCGDGQDKPKIQSFIQKHNLTNIKLMGFVSKPELLQFINNCDVCLGIFGNSGKAKKVLTNKVFQILASQKPLITMESETSKEAGLKNSVNCMLVPPALPQDLANAILFLKNNSEKCKEIAFKGHQIYLQYMSMEKIGKKLVDYINELQNKK